MDVADYLDLAKPHHEMEAINLLVDCVDSALEESIKQQIADGVYGDRKVVIFIGATSSMQHLHYHCDTLNLVHKPTLEQKEDIERLREAGALTEIVDFVDFGKRNDLPFLPIRVEEDPGRISGLQLNRKHNKKKKKR
jgi:hypothetical protein